jgi:hypothetical protein
MMAFFGSPLKLSPSSPKRRKETLNWEQCIIGYTGGTLGATGVDHSTVVREVETCE